MWCAGVLGVCGVTHAPHSTDSPTSFPVHSLPTHTTAGEFGSLWRGVYEGRMGKEVGESVACDACVRWVGGVGWDGMELGWDGVGLNRGVIV